MDIKLYRLDVVVQLESIYQIVPPLCTVSLNDQIIFQGPVAGTKTITYQATLPPTSHALSICYTKKSKKDPTQAILIKSIVFNKIQDQKFIWNGKYKPNYPETWAAEQQASGNNLQEQITDTNCLGWEGCWVLNFDTPIFTWIHKIKNFGIIYD
jgi:hypothetical protein